MCQHGQPRSRAELDLVSQGAQEYAVGWGIAPGGLGKTRSAYMGEIPLGNAKGWDPVGIRRGAWWAIAATDRGPGLW